MLDARNVFRKVTRKIYDFSPEQTHNLPAIVWLYPGEPDRFLDIGLQVLAQVVNERHWPASSGRTKTGRRSEHYRPRLSRQSPRSRTTGAVPTNANDDRPPCQRRASLEKEKKLFEDMASGGFQVSVREDPREEIGEDPSGHQPRN